MAEYVSSDGDPVPEVVFEAVFETYHRNVVHVRVTGDMGSFDYLLSRFIDLCNQHRNQPKGTNYDTSIR